MGEMGGPGFLLELWAQIRRALHSAQGSARPGAPVAPVRIVRRASFLEAQMIRQHGRNPDLWGDRREKVLELLDVPRPISYLQAVTGWTLIVTREVLVRLADEGIVRTTGGGRYSRWERI